MTESGPRNETRDRRGEKWKSKGKWLHRNLGTHETLDKGPPGPNPVSGHFDTSTLERRILKRDKFGRTLNPAYQNPYWPFDGDFEGAVRSEILRD